MKAATEISTNVTIKATQTIVSLDQNLQTFNNIFANPILKTLKIYMPHSKLLATNW
jgi:hypothetical protein